MSILDFKVYKQDPRLFHGGDYNPDQWLQDPKILEDDVKFMEMTNSNAFSVGIFAWAALEPTEGNFQFEWLDKIINNIHSIDGKVLLATPSGARPAWLAQKYPEVLRTNNRGEKMRWGGRHNHCFSSPVYREKIGILNQKLAERYKNHPAILMWHVSNEYSGECFCDLCQENFRKFIQEKYETVENLNAAYWSAFWSHTYTDFSQVEPPSPIGEDAVHALNLDWMRFITHQTIDFYRHEIKDLRKITPQIPITTNFMSDMIAPHPFNGLDYAQFAKEVDMISWDAYPAWHNDYESTEFLASKLGFLNDYYRSLKNQPFLILESAPSMVNWQPVNKAKRPGMHMLSSIAKIAHGADSVMYFQWRKSRGSSEKFHGAVVDHDNSRDNRVFKDVENVGHMLRNISEIKNTSTPAKVAIIFDTQTQWIIDNVQGFSRQSRQYPQTVHAHYKALWDMDIPVDVITPDKNLDKYSVVIAPMLYLVGDALANKFDQFVQNGGHLVATYMTGIANETDLVHPNMFHPTLSKVFGLNVSEIDTFYPSDRNFIKGFAITDKNQYEVTDYAALLKLTTAKSMASYGADFYRNSPAIAENEHGSGRAYYIGPRTSIDFLTIFYSHIIGKHITLAAVNRPPVNVPQGVSVQTRQKFTKNYYFIMNFTEEEQEITLEVDGQDILSGQLLKKGPHRLKRYGAYICKV